MKRCFELLLMVVLALTGAANATNQLVNGSFQSGNFSGWTLGTTSNGTAGIGLPIVTAWPLGGMNAAKYEVGEVNSDGTYQGVTLSQAFTSSGGTATFSVMWAASSTGSFNADGGKFELILDGTVVGSYDVGPMFPVQTVHGVLSDTLFISPGQHTFEVDILRHFVSFQNSTPFQYITGAVADAPSTVPEPSSLLLLISGVTGVAGIVRRRVC